MSKRGALRRRAAKRRQTEAAAATRAAREAVAAAPPAWVSELVAISFDLDDTIWDCAPVLVLAEATLQTHFVSRGHGAVFEVYRTHRARLEARVRAEAPHLQHNVSHTRRECLRFAALEHGKTEEDSLALASEAFEAFYHARSYHVSKFLYEGSCDALRRLRELGVVVCTVTNGNANVALIPELRDLVDHAVTAEEAGAAKPHPLPFERLLAKLGEAVQPAQVLHVGDSWSADVVGALEMGLRAAWITAADPTEQSLVQEKQVLVAPTVKALVDWLAPHLARRADASSSGSSTSTEVETTQRSGNL